MARQVYIECTHGNSVTAKLYEKSGEVREFKFFPRVVNKYTGVPDHTGFTAINAEDYDRLLKESRVFKAFTASKALVARDRLPDSVQTPTEMIAEKNAEIVRLSAAVEELRSGGKFTQSDIDAAVKAATEPLLAQIASLQDELNAPGEAEEAIPETDTEVAPKKEGKKAKF